MSYDQAMMEGHVLVLGCSLLQVLPEGCISVSTDAFCLWDSLPAFMGYA